MDNKKKTLLDETFLNLTLDEIISDRFGRYAKYIIQDRALPDVRDGLKPVQRRIIFAMNDLGLTNDKAYKKSARTVGEVIGKYHPHGDSSIYEAMVRMAQDWKNNAPLLDMHGNKGSIDGDSPAAMRYTEARLSKITNLMLANIDKKTVKFVTNFDDSEQEPSVLPGLVPNLLINGATGIAAGYATNIPPHNLVEVIDAIITRIDSPNCRLDSLMKSLLGPDLPTGGVIQGIEGIKQAYSTGKGRIIIRAKISVEQTKNLEQIIISEIPYETSKSTIVRQIDEIRIEEKIQGINEVRDESDRNGLRIAIDLKKGASIATIKTYLLKNTSLQISYNLNLVGIIDRKPIQMNLMQIIDSYINHQIEIITKAATWDLQEAKSRQEIVVGLIKAIKVLDDVVEIIRRSKDKEDAKNNLQLKFQLTPNQSEAIVQLRLFRLTATNIEELNNELVQLDQQIINLSALLSSDEVRRNNLKMQLRAIKKEFGNDRKTIIEDQIEELKLSESEIVVDSEVEVISTYDGYVKSISTKSSSASEYETLGVKQGDLPVFRAITTSLSKVILLTTNGNYFCIPAYKIKQTKWKDIGMHLNDISVLQPNEKIIGGLAIENFSLDKRCLVLVSKNGMIKRVKINELELLKFNRASLIMNLDDNDKMVSWSLSNDDNSFVGCVTQKGTGLAFSESEVSIVGPKAAGVKAINLSENDEVAGVFVTNDENALITIIARQGAKRIHFKEFFKAGRATKGREILQQVKNNPILVINTYIVNVKSILNVIDEQGKWKMLNVKDIAIADANSRVSSVGIKSIIYSAPDELKE